MGNYSNILDYGSNLKLSYKHVLANWISSQTFNLGLTLNFNYGGTSKSRSAHFEDSKRFAIERRNAESNTNSASRLNLARRQVGELFGRVDRKLLGTRFNKKPHLRTHGVFFFEHVDTNIHAHGLIDVRGDRVTDFKDIMLEPPNIWMTVCSSGSYWIDDLTNIRAAAYYDTKEQKPWSDPQTTLWLEEFFPTAG